MVNLGTFLVRMVRLCCHSAASDMGNGLKCDLLKPSHEKGLVSVILKLLSMLISGLHGDRETLSPSKSAGDTK